jgi:hemoglobin-like flavoprotein
MLVALAGWCESTRRSREVACVTPDQKVLVQQSFRLVEPIADTAAELFYSRLFEVDPSLRHLFRGDMREQRRKLMQMLTVAVRGLDQLDAIVPAVQALGRRHVGYGVQPQHFDTVGAALLWALAQGLGPAFTTDVRNAWAAVYDILSSVMKASMSEASLRPAA